MTRHTWQSWRERYKKNSTRLDTLITAIVDQKRPAPGEQGQYGYVRQTEEKPKRPRKKRKVTGASLGSDNFIIENESEVIAPKIEGMGIMQMDVPPVDLNVQSVFQQYMGLPVAGPSPVRRSPAEEEMDDENEWQVRVGQEPPPAWGKRVGAEQLSREGENKLQELQ